MEHTMNGAELASQLKGQLNSNMKFNGISGIDDESLHLTEEDIKWWRDAKFGMFIHWGVYSVLGKGEWVYFNNKLDEDYYRTLAKEKFIPNRGAEQIMNDWTQTAVNSGMKYAVMVTRHHDGYALWDSKCSYKNFTSILCGSGEDYVKAFTAACHNKGLYMGLYYSPMDWRFKGYFDPEGEPESAAEMKAQGYGQIEELCSKYGKLDILWYDGGWLAHKGTDADASWLWEPIKLNKMVRSYNQKTMVTPRSGYKGDFECDEGSHEIKGSIVPVPWEKNMSLTSSWAYRPSDKTWSANYIITMLVNAICRDGNLLLNVAPDVNGRIAQNSLNVLEEVGSWLKENGEAVYGTRAGIWQPVDDVFGSVYKNKTIYLHILNCNKFDEVVLSPIKSKIITVEILNGNETTFTQDETKVKVIIPDYIKERKLTDTIIKITLENQEI